jgi:hypothetical protein
MLIMVFVYPWWSFAAAYGMFSFLPAGAAEAAGFGFLPILRSIGFLRTFLGRAEFMEMRPACQEN